ncbi:MAG: hypothetical protein JWP95_1553, partial [Actinotalea sp.]|nr:hypothetical protein [Actinotalea sp.]
VLRQDADDAALLGSAATEACADARTALDAAKDLAASLARRTALRDELATLTRAAADHRERVARRAGGRRAELVLPLVTGSDRAAVALERAELRVVAARSAAPVDLQDLVDPFAEPDVQRKALVVERDRCTSLRGSLVRLVELEAGLPARYGEIAAGEAARAGKATERTRLAGDRALRPDQRRLLVGTASDEAEAAAGLGAAQERVAAAQVRLSAARDVTRLAGEVTAAEAVLGEVAAGASAAVVRAAEVQQARIAGIAGELAQHLTPGAPCAVCGGVEHPAPATPGPDHVTVEDVEAAERDRTAAAAALGEASAALAGVRLRLETRRAVAGTDEGTAASELAAAQQAVNAAQVAVRRHKEAEAALAGFDLGTQQLDSRLSGLTAQLAAEDARLAGLRAQVQRDEADVATARDGAGSVRELSAALSVRTGLVTAWIDALVTVEDAREQHGVRAVELAAALAEQDFATADDVRAHAVPSTELAALDRAVTQHETALARVLRGLDEPEVAALPEVVEADVPRAQAVHHEAEQAARVACGQAAALRQRWTAGSTALEQLEAAVGAFRTAEAESGPVVRMANLAAASGGDNAEQLTLATYVLARRFEDVVAAANGRLVTLSDGRYELAHNAGREDVRARKRGLALTVVDHRTGRERDPRTLSGGETFYVSLCLALGLADVVTAEAGGIDLGTLFVDEGFGSLDPETLDVVVAELGRLREGGRVVGVVSHVEALKQSIAERIEVRRLEDGSSTLTVRA